MEELLTLPGVGRKTANLVLILAHREPPRTSASTRTCTASPTAWAGSRPGRPRRPSRRSTRRRSRRWWPVINLYLVTWGQNVCRPVYPLCPQCVARRFLSEDRRHAGREASVSERVERLTGRAGAASAMLEHAGHSSHSASGCARRRRGAAGAAEVTGRRARSSSSRRRRARSSSRPIPRKRRRPSRASSTS